MSASNITDRGRQRSPCSCGGQTRVCGGAGDHARLVSSCVLRRSEGAKKRPGTIGGELYESVGVGAPILLSYTHKN